MSTRTLRGLAAGAGAAAVLFAGAAGASAIDGQPQESHWEDYFAGQGYENVSCEESVVSGDPGVLTLNVAEDTWGTYLEDGNDWIGVVIKVANDYDVKAWSGYGDYVFEGEVPGNSEGNITHAYICQATAADDDDDDDDGVTPGDGDETDEPTETEDPTDDGDDKDKDDDKDDKPTGPPVETDGPATPSGPNMGLMGGAALLLGGAGAAGWAMRRRTGEH
ncbi:hypothetical protein [Ornithinimicrobium kibberense]|uniref:LPXTG-motif cell wall-anchored protein n=1 Tax=Ornithinimicrobium kibberense TaxID=282060 RepID=A0ABV5V5F0_9MICO|nr:hypothetical protein [Ornithinimicrobium kibberense]